MPTPQELNDLILRAISKRHKDAIIDLEDCAPTDYLSTGLPSVDAIIGAPGLPCGRLTTIMGNPAAGKSTLLYNIFRVTQQRGGVCLLIETEDAVDKERLRELGVDPDRMIIAQPEYAEQAIDIIKDSIVALRTEYPDDLLVVGWDSVAATPVKAEIEEDTEKAVVGGHARVLSKGLRTLTKNIQKHKVALVFVHQWREKVGAQPFQPSKTMLAERAVRYHSSVLLEVSQHAKLKEKAGEDAAVHGTSVKVEVLKNRLAAPFKVAYVNLNFATGFDAAASWLDLAVSSGVVKKQAGGWYVLPETEGKLRAEQAQAVLLESGDLRDQVLAAAGLTPRTS